MTLIQFIGGIALPAFLGGVWIGAMLTGLILTSLHADIRRNPSRHGGDEYTDLNSIGGGDGFHHGGADK